MIDLLPGFQYNFFSSTCFASLQYLIVVVSLPVFDFRPFKYVCIQTLTLYMCLRLTLHVFFCNRKWPWILSALSAIATKHQKHLPFSVRFSSINVYFKVVQKQLSNILDFGKFKKKNDFFRIWRQIFEFEKNLWTVTVQLCGNCHRLWMSSDSTLLNFNHAFSTLEMFVEQNTEDWIFDRSVFFGYPNTRFMFYQNKYIYSLPVFNWQIVFLMK